MLSLDSLGLYPKAIEKKTSRGYAYEVMTHYDDCGDLKLKRIEFPKDVDVPASELAELFGAEFMMTPLDNIMIFVKRDGDNARVAMQYIANLSEI